MTAPNRIDVHHHILPADYVDALARIGVTGGGDIPFPKWTAESALETLDRQGIATAVTSISAPGLHFGDDAFARDLARRCNELSAKLVTEHPSRFGAFVTLPLPDVEGSLRELAYGLDVLRLDGVVLLSSFSDGSYLGDPRYEELMAEIERRGATIFVHPVVPKTSESIRLAIPGAAAEFVFDTTRAAANLVFSGTLERHPQLKIILSHAGGTLPYLVGRLSLMGMLPHLREKAPQGAPHYLRRFYYDTALSANPHTLRCLRELVGPDHILFGSDYPFAPEPVVQASVAGLASYDGFSAADRARIERDSALAILPSVAARQKAAM